MCSRRGGTTSHPASPARQASGAADGRAVCASGMITYSEPMIRPRGCIASSHGTTTVGFRHSAARSQGLMKADYGLDMSKVRPTLDGKKVSRRHDPCLAFRSHWRHSMLSHTAADQGDWRRNSALHALRRCGQDATAAPDRVITPFRLSALLSAATYPGWTKPEREGTTTPSPWFLPARVLCIWGSVRLSVRLSVCLSLCLSVSVSSSQISVCRKRLVMTNCSSYYTDKVRLL